MIDRAHRVAGILLICVLVLGLVAGCQLAENTNLQREANAARIRYPVIVVPEATTGVYSPTEEDRLIFLFTDFVTQSLLSFTPVNMRDLYANLRPYMGPALLTDSEPHFQKKIRDALSDRRSSFFIPDRARNLDVTKQTINGAEIRNVSIYGQLSTFVGGTTAESIPVKISMTLQKVFASPANKYGFLLTAYHEEPLVNPNETPRLPGGRP
ncbi:MAG: hypothetical protein EOP20_00330 [Hyphomicrobiales bacterium]|nr:MAG: hypothetical protein EOP20_00330 [Hyphomicrobiales bacterium]